MRSIPFKNKREATKKSKDRKINGKCTNGTNGRSRVWPVYFIYHHHVGLEGKCDTRDKNLSTALADSSNNSRAPLDNLECK